MLEVVQAYDRSSITELPTDNAADLERKLASATRVFADRDNWLRPFERIEILWKLAALVEAQREKFGLLIAREGGKPLTDALIEVDRAVDGVRTATETLRLSAGREIPMGITRSSVDRRAFTINEPIGVVGAISAFNHPLNLIVHQVVPAIAVGCPVIVKPASATPLCCLDFVDLVHEAGLSPDWCQTLLPESREVFEAFAADSRVAFLSFIGSSEVGWRLRSKLAPGTRCALEHGGVAPAIVDRDIDLDTVIEPLAKGGYYHAGQVCVSVQRIFVHEDVLQKFLELYSARVESLNVGDPTRIETEVGPLIDPREADRVEAWINEAAADGAGLVGGGRISETTLRPAILIDPSPSAKVSSHEVFGPVTCVYRYADLNDAIARANSLSVAFQSSIFTNNLKTALYAAERLDAAAVMINDHTAFRTDWMPFAGRRESGYGTGGIPWTMREMTAAKMVVIRN
jgi:acyl-CoA reductase-like NAD-dependent aldehyde dehydrogenase